MNIQLSTSIFAQKKYLLLLLWLILTLINIDKAFHIDDTFHLSAAEYIRDHPTKPMSGLVNWEDNPSPFYTHNQPPLFFYLIALCSSVFGSSEFSLHLLLSVFTFLALYFFRKTTDLFPIQKKNTLLLLFAFCPAFIINQNVMVDVPILALILGMAYYLLKARKSNKTVHYVYSALCLSIGLLIKYSILPLLIVLLLVILAKKAYRQLPVLLIPLGILSIWSFWNYCEFGAIHILSRPKEGIHINRLWAFLACTGSLSTFSFSLLSGAFPYKFTKPLLYSTFVLFLLSIGFFYSDYFLEANYAKGLNIAFIILGFLTGAAIIAALLKYLKKGLRHFIQSDQCIIFLYIAALSLFLILFAPFIATRHVLLVIPFILIFCHEHIQNTSQKTNQLSIVCTVILGLILGISDWNNADYYRTMAASIDLPEEGTVWASGHWGWKYYAAKRGMKAYSTNEKNIKSGDYLIVPSDISAPKTNKYLTLELVSEHWEEANLLTFFSGNDFASLYNSSVSKPPWTLSKSPIDTIYVYKITAVDF